jgi:hypothetical protein
VRRKGFIEERARGGPGVRRLWGLGSGEEPFHDAIAELGDVELILNALKIRVF